MERLLEGLLNRSFQRSSHCLEHRSRSCFLHRFVHCFTYRSRQRLVKDSPQSSGECSTQRLFQGLFHCLFERLLEGYGGGMGGYFGRIGARMLGLEELGHFPWASGMCAIIHIETRTGAAIPTVSAGRGLGPSQAAGRKP